MILDYKEMIKIKGGNSFRNIISNLREIVYYIYEHFMYLTKDCKCRVRKYK